MKRIVTIRKFASALALGLMLLAVPAQAQTWSAASTGITGAEALSARAVAASPTTGTVIYGGGGASGETPAAEAGLYRSTDSGDSWTHVLNMNPRQIVATSDGTFYAAGPGFGVHKSTDDGATWAAVNSGITDDRIFALTVADDDDGVTLFAGAQTAIFRSFNEGATWANVNDGFDTNALATGDGEDVWAGEFNFDGTLTGLHKSENFGDDWSAVGLPGETVNAIYVTGDVVLVGVSPGDEVVGGLYRSDDGGATFTRLSNPDESLYDFTMDAQGRIWAAGSFGAHVSEDLGATWTLDSSGVPDEDGAFRSLDFNPVDNRLYAAERFTDTPVYRSVEITGTSSEIAEDVRALRLGVPYPSPLSSTASFAVGLDAPETVVVTLHDLLGREVARLHEGVLAPGARPFTLDATSLPSGLYLLRAAGETGVATQTVTVVR
jgi:photosystem II stability/assembly factor-like uncharacterized protein